MMPEDVHDVPGAANNWGGEEGEGKMNFVRESQRNGIYYRMPYFLGFSSLRLKKNDESHRKTDKK